MVTETEARHQQVRAFVEQQYPHCRVTDIEEDTRTQYKRELHGTDYVLAGLRVRFRVEAQSHVIGQPSVRCDVHLLPDGGLRIGDFWWVQSFR